jgi:hypothetical protein
MPSAEAAGRALANGLVLCAESSSLTYHPRDTQRRTKRRLQTSLKRWAAPGPAVRSVAVPPYDISELGAALAFYRSANAWQPADAAHAAAAQVHLLTASRGELVRKLCTQLA